MSAAVGLPTRSSDDPLRDWIDEHGKQFNAERGQDLRELSNAASIFLLSSGWVLRSRILSDGRDCTTATYVPGDIINLANVVAPQSYDTLVALTPIETVIVSDRDLRRASHEDGDIAFSIMRRFLADSHWLREALAAIGQLKAKDRLFFYVVQTRNRMIAYGSLDRKTTTFPFPLTQLELAQTIGITPVHVNRVLKEHLSEGVMKIDHRMLHILDLAEFEQRAISTANLLNDGHQ